MSAKNGVLAFLGGAAIGAVVALLFAPEKGEVTRRKIGRAVSDGKDRVVDAVESGRDYVVDAYHKGRERLADAIHEGREMVEDEVIAACDKAKKEIKHHR